MLGDWHNDLPYTTRKGQPGGVLDLGRLFLKLYLLRSSFLFYLYLEFFVICIVVVVVFFFFLLMMFFVFPNGFADRNTVVPNFNLMNQASLEKILKAEVFVHTDE